MAGHASAPAAAASLQLPTISVPIDGGTYLTHRQKYLAPALLHSPRPDLWCSTAQCGTETRGLQAWDSGPRGNPRPPPGPAARLVVVVSLLYPMYATYTSPHRRPAGLDTGWRERLRPSTTRSGKESCRAADHGSGWPGSGSPLCIRLPEVSHRRSVDSTSESNDGARGDRANAALVMRLFTTLSQL